MVSEAKVAQNIFSNYTQQQIDQCIRAVGKVVYDHAELLANDAVSETNMGNVQDKILKNKGTSKTVWNNLKDKKSVGIIEINNTKGITSVAKPVGVVCAVAPITSPSMTIMCNVMFALKGGHAVVVAPHSGAKNVSVKTVQLMNAELENLGAPANLVQCINEPSIRLTGD